MFFRFPQFFSALRELTLLASLPSKDESFYEMAQLLLYRAPLLYFVTLNKYIYFPVSQMYSYTLKGLSLVEVQHAIVKSTACKVSGLFSEYGVSRCRCISFRMSESLAFPQILKLLQQLLHSLGIFELIRLSVPIYDLASVSMCARHQIFQAWNDKFESHLPFGTQYNITFDESFGVHVCFEL